MAPKVSIKIIVRFSFEGIHCWPAAPDHLREAYLRHPHRHMFHVEATKVVTHTERDIEIIALKNAMQDYCLTSLKGPHTLSCEAMALALLEYFGLCCCRVLEDDENGAEVSCE